MHQQTEKDLRSIADRILETPIGEYKKRGARLRDDAWGLYEDAWEIFREEAYARYNAEDDGPGHDYQEDVAKIFGEQADALDLRIVSFHRHAGR